MRLYPTSRLIRNLIPVAAVALALLLGACSKKKTGPTTQASGGTVAAAPAKQNPYEFRSLFDGKSLANWKITDFGAHGIAKVKDGTIVIPVGDPMSGITWDGSQIPKINYEIALDAQKVNGNDFFCGLTFPVADSHASLILGGWGGGVCGISSIDGYDASENETSKGITFEDKRWYSVRVRVMQDKIQAWLDDEKIVDVVIKGRRISTRIEVDVSKPLGVATYMTTGALRNIRMRQLREDEIERVTDTDTFK